MDCGLTLLKPNHFDVNFDTKGDFERLNNDGFPFLIKSICQKSSTGLKIQIQTKVHIL